MQSSHASNNGICRYNRHVEKEMCFVGIFLKYFCQLKVEVDFIFICVFVDRSIRLSLSHI